MLRWIRTWLRASPGTETSRLIVGSTGSGKSEGELVDLVRLAERRDCAVVLLDGHGPLALRTAGHWIPRGHEARLVYEPLDATDRVLCWDMLPRSYAANPSRRLLEDAETRDELAQCFLAQRNLATAADRPLTREWLEAAITLCLGQPGPQPLPSLLSAFRVGSPAYGRLLRDCTDPAVVDKFRELERVHRRSAVQYEIQTGASRRLLEAVCSSEVVRLRSRPGPFDWLQAVRERKLIAFDGGGIRSREIRRTLFLLVSMQVIHAVRRHFAETQRPLPVVLVLEEAGVLGLVTPFVSMALQELRKAGLSVHLITQSSLDFGDQAVFEGLLANTPWQAWYQCLSPADQEIGARALANATFSPHAVHFTRPRQVRDGVEPVATETRGESLDAHGHVRGHDTRTGSALVPRFRETDEAYYKSPSLHEQEYRTRLATLRIGERIVRDRTGVRRERVKLLRPPRRQHRFGDATREAIERIRRQPIYLPPAPTPPDASAAVPHDAAARLRSERAE
ncbi:MAG TPA: type IV secretory system conjugative DNA transfer family protein [Urbifossiella sp.]|nr:type IV secretory system conjugative DNA transfer family protein [Urbifossiella sp.]